MGTWKFFFISTVTFLIFSCFIFQATVFAEDEHMEEQSGVSIYIPETDEEIVIDDQMDVEEEIDTYYEDTEESEVDEDIYIEDDRFPDIDEEPGYEETLDKE